MSLDPVFYEDLLILPQGLHESKHPELVRDYLQQAVTDFASEKPGLQEALDSFLRLYPQ